MRICFFSHSSRLDSSERSLLELVTRLTGDYKVRCYVVLPTDGILREKLATAGATISIVEYPWWCDTRSVSPEEIILRLNSGFHNVIKHAGEVLTRINPDVIATFTIAIPWGAVAAAVLGKPHVWFIPGEERLEDLKFFLAPDKVQEIVAASSQRIIINSDVVRQTFLDSLTGDKIVDIEIDGYGAAGASYGDRLYVVMRELVADSRTTAPLLPSFFADLVKGTANELVGKKTLTREVARLTEAERECTKERADLENTVGALRIQLSNAENILHGIMSSKTWSLGQFYGKILGAESRWRRWIRDTFHRDARTGVKMPAPSALRQDAAAHQHNGLQDFLTDSVGGAADVSKHDVICLPIIDWFFRYQRPQHLLAQFAGHGSRVFYVNPKFIEGRRGGFSVKKIRQRIFDVGIEARRPVNIYQDRLDDKDVSHMMSSLDSLRKTGAIVEAVVIVQLPFWEPLAGKIRREFGWKVVYDCMDDHSGFSSNRDAMLSLEGRLAAECDLLVVSSKKLCKAMERYNSRFVLIPNAADFDHFSRLPENDLLAAVSKPIIGYYGAISDWFDNSLVEYLADCRKDWNFVLIGHTFGADISRLKKMPNVHFLGEKPYGELPAYLLWFDVCIIPFKLNRLIEATSPVKFYEFMSAGKKVVSVDLPELLPYAKYVRLAKDKDDFLVKIEEALQEKDADLMRERVELGREHTWEKRYDLLQSEIIRIHPKASVVVVTYNNLEFTKLCIQSIFSNTFYPNYEIIVVDNCSTDDTRSYLRGLSAENDRVKIILNETNEGFSRANNRGIAAADGEYIVLLNNDTIVTRGWMSRLLRHLEDKTIGMVGPVTNFCGNEARIDVPYKTVEGLQDFAEQYIKEHMDPESFDIRVLAMYCVAMRRPVVDDIGLLDEQFGIGMFEDDDYAHRVRLKGYRVVCAEDIFVHHFGETSFKKLKEDGSYMALFEENRRKYEEKWGIKWKAHKPRHG